jgi:hypothetical protein
MDLDRKSIQNISTNVEDKKNDHHNKQWTNPIEFLMTCIGFAVIIFLIKY